jgi:hypothetical protein
MEELTIYGEIMNAFLIFLTLHQSPRRQLLKLGGHLKIKVSLHPHNPFFRLKNNYLSSPRPPPHLIDSVNPSTAVLEREVSASR